MMRVKPREKKRRKKSSSLPLPSSIPSFSLLPDDITINYLARIPRAYYRRLSAVSKSFHSLLSSNELYTERSQLGSTEQCLYVSMWVKNRPPQWFTLWINPNRTLDHSCVSKKKTIGQLLVPIPPTNMLNSNAAVVVGSEIYTIGGNIGRVRFFDCRTHTWRDAPHMKAARWYASSCVYDGKIYVLGGCKEDDEPWAEVFDTKTHTWECLPDPGTEIRKCTVYKVMEIKGKLCFGYCSDNVMTMYSYDPNQGKWEHCRNVSLNMFLWSECVIENVSYSCCYNYNMYDGPLWISWYDINVGTWKQVKGLESFQEKHAKIRRTCCFSSSKLVSCGGKLLRIWEEGIKNSKRFGALKSKWKSVIEVRFGERLSGMMLCLPPPLHISSRIVSPSWFD